MKREIKFRAKSLETKEWVYGMLVYHIGSAFIHQEEDEEFSIGKSIHGGKTPFESDFIQVDSNTICRWTGMKDANNRDIYEKDWLVPVKKTSPHYDNGELNYVEEVDFIFGCWQIVYVCVNKDLRGVSEGINEILDDDGTGGSNYNVIGNVFDSFEEQDEFTKADALGWIASESSDYISKLFYYDRKDCEDMPLEKIEEIIKEGLITEDIVKEAFNKAIEEAFTDNLNS